MQALDTYITRKFEDKQLIEVQIIKKRNSRSLNNYVRQFGKVVQIPSHGCVWVKLESKKVVRFPLEHIRIVGVSMKRDMDNTNQEDIYEDNYDSSIEDYCDNTAEVEYSDYPEEEYYEDEL